MLSNKTILSVQSILSYVDLPTRINYIYENLFSCQSSNCVQLLISIGKRKYYFRFADRVLHLTELDIPVWKINLIIANTELVIDSTKRMGNWGKNNLNNWWRIKSNFGFTRATFFVRSDFFRDVCQF